MLKETLPIVQKFAQYGLDESRQSIELYHKWLSVWSFGLVGELGEAYKCLDSDDYDGLEEEIADFCWYTIALGLLLKEVPALSMTIIEPFSRTKEEKLEMLVQATLQGLMFTEKVKKYLRDYPKRSIEYIHGYKNPLIVLNGVFDFSNVADTLNAKLSRRYPNGFNPSDSANRIQP